jgi:hypothetical protein
MIQSPLNSTTSWTPKSLNTRTFLKGTANQNHKNRVEGNGTAELASHQFSAMTFLLA